MGRQWIQNNAQANPDARTDGKLETDEVFQSDCLAFALFHNNIQAKHGVNHWIPFAESDVDSREKFEIHFMSYFIAGRPEQEQGVTQQTDIFGQEQERRRMSMDFSPDARRT